MEYYKLTLKINRMKITKCILFSWLLLSSVCLIAQSYKVPAYSTFKLQNGLTVNLMEQHEVPLINVSIILPAGAINDQNQSGIASLTATALKHGTKNYSKLQLEEALNYVGANVNTYAAKEFTILSASFAAYDRAKVLGIIKEIMVEPVFDADAFNKEKSRLLTILEQQKESPDGLIRSYFDKALFGNQVYGNLLDGNSESVSKLTVEDVRQFYKNNYSPNETAISIVGDFSTEEMKKTVTNLFSSWQKSSTTHESAAEKPIDFPKANRVLLLNKDDATETTFYIGSKGVSRSNSDIVAIEVINAYFGGRFTSLLNDELRISTGLTYGAGSWFPTYKYSGSFIISTFTANKTTEAAIDKTLEVIAQFHKNGIDEKSLTSAKNYIKGQFPPRYETSGQLAGLLSEMFWYQFDASYIDNFEKNVDGLDLAKANEIIAKYFPKNHFQFVLIGKASEIKKIAGKYGKVTEMEIKKGP